MKIAISGAGIAGLVVALFLRQNGHEVEILEKAVQPRSQGAGITLGPNAMKILTLLGLSEKISAVGRRIEVAEITDERLQAITRIDFDVLYQKTGYPAYAIQREELHKILIRELPQGIIRSNTWITAIEDKDIFSIVTNQGSIESFDFLVGADGIHSGTRKLLFGDVPQRYSGYSCWRFLVPFENWNDLNAMESWGKGKRVGIVPVGNGMVYGFVVLNLKKEIQPPDWSSVKSIFAEFHHAVNEILHRVEEENLIYNPLYDLPDNYFYSGKTVFIGDASHAMTPNLGQGAAMAIEDAKTLVDSIQEYKDVPVGFEHYKQRRSKRVTTVKNRSHRMGQVGQLENTLAMGLRNVIFRSIPESFILKDLEKLLMNL